MNTWSIRDLIDDQTSRELAEIAGLLEEAYEHYFEFSDGYCKSSEGWIQIDIPAYFWRRDEGEAVERPSVGVYSYALGPHRFHSFESSTEALEAVKVWHEREMATDYDENGESEYGGLPLQKIINGLGEES